MVFAPRRKQCSVIQCTSMVRIIISVDVISVDIINVDVRSGNYNKCAFPSATTSKTQGSTEYCMLVVGLIGFSYLA